MSFTLNYHKDGKLVPIKMSIWDAFRGDPGPRNQGQKCQCCGKIHLENKDPNSKSNKNEPPKAKIHSTSATEEFSAQDDATIIRMKNEGATWAKILEAISKTSKSQLQAHYKQIRPQNQDSQNVVASEQDGAGSKKKGRQAERKSTSNDSSDTKTKDSDIRAWADGYDRKKWISVASKHYDMTGQRISPEMARTLAGAT